MPVEARPHGGDLEEGPAVGHAAQIHLVHFHARSGQDVERGPDLRIDRPHDHDESGTRPGGGRHRVAEEQPPRFEGVDTALVLPGEIGPRQGRGVGEPREGGDERIGVETRDDLDGDDLPRRIEGGEPGRLPGVLGPDDVVPGDGEQRARHDLEDLRADRVDDLSGDARRDGPSELRGDEPSVFELEKGHRPSFHSPHTLAPLFHSCAHETRPCTLDVPGRSARHVERSGHER